MNLFILPSFPICWHKLFIVFPYNLLYFCGSVVTSPLSFLILFVYVLSLLFLMCPDDADSVLQSPYVVDAMNKFTQTTEVLWRKGNGMATL